MRNWIAGLLLGAACGMTAAQAAYPERGVKIIVPYPAGQTTDVIARAIGQELGEAMGQAFFVDNRGGAGGIIGMEAAKRSEPDGYTLLMTASGPVAINPGLYRKLPYNVEKDYEPVALVAMVPLFLVVRADFPANNVRELLDYVKRHPGELNYGSGGSGLTNHLAMEMFKSQAGLNITHVPYRGASAALTGLMSGDVAMMFEAGPAIMPHVQSGALKVLAVGGKEPARAFPKARPVSTEGVPGYEAQAWIALLAPAGTPKPVIDQLNAATRKALGRADLQDKLAGLGAETVSVSPADTRQFIQREITVWGQAVKASNARVD
ncbi:Bug family tripartite tricarboxylate transporter substrate binding protein [Bordetella hinzii]|uniref:Tripartite tricarboxylate transporter family receptor n=1 Tax=Bordetella hinzii OH87 BAL007II TaxID=1331262 RepID=A0ABR4R6Y4_9BORD|nr:tripartite tricarboxylate transporter substrate binding protein [Bordetella hinzii]AKQ54103.1 Tripartite tricarboxylate transporter family receptor [Bordetella hinzii]KCB26206.1 tripartite tricarboxylate transporter family receptor [Bordetella hinzii OH87 BAL007II]KCB26786.1 tripartite tricarboxylate transporter family receptor [Bordetella hinzii L60]KCB40137.1 tripartite tricarboxylate transporter family receptor [Bordetella hinzii 5132]QDJ44043.1 tripartite tricarboxylate transporter subs